MTQKKTAGEAADTVNSGAGFAARSEIADLADLSVVPNLRDIGGAITADGQRIATEVVFRSSHLQDLTPSGQALLEQIGISTAIDLRSQAERAGGDYHLPAGATGVWFDVLADDPESAAAFQRLFSKGDLHTVTADDTAAFMGNSYRHMVELASARNAYRRTYEIVADPEAGTVLVHCTAGKDRTGWAAAALLLWLGAPEEYVRDDYLRSNQVQTDLIDQLVAAFTAAGGDPQAVHNLITVRDGYLDTALERVAHHYGDMDRYFREGLGLSPHTLASLRTRLLVD